MLQHPTRTALQEIIDNVQAAAMTEYRMLAGATVPHFRNSLLALINEINNDQLDEAIATKPLADLWSRADGASPENLSTGAEPGLCRRFGALVRLMTLHFGSHEGGCRWCRARSARGFFHEE